MPPSTNIQPNKNDVHFGRGKGNYNEPGNKYFRALVGTLLDDYERGAQKRGGKMRVVKLVVSTVGSLDPPGRFIKEKDGKWVHAEEKMIKNKVAQEFRDQLAKRNGGYGGGTNGGGAHSPQQISPVPSVKPAINVAPQNIPAAGAGASAGIPPIPVATTTAAPPERQMYDEYQTLFTDDNAVQPIVSATAASIPPPNNRGRHHRHEIAGLIDEGLTQSFGNSSAIGRSSSGNNNESSSSVFDSLASALVQDNHGSSVWQAAAPAPSPPPPSQPYVTQTTAQHQWPGQQQQQQPPLVQAYTAHEPLRTTNYDHHHHAAALQQQQYQPQQQQQNGRRQHQQSSEVFDSLASSLVQDHNNNNSTTWAQDVRDPEFVMPQPPASRQSTKKKKKSSSRQKDHASVAESLVHSYTTATTGGEQNLPTDSCMSMSDLMAAPAPSKTSNKKNLHSSADLFESLANSLTGGGMSTSDLNCSKNLSFMSGLTASELEKATAAAAPPSMMEASSHMDNNGNKQKSRKKNNRNTETSVASMDAGSTIMDPAVAAANATASELSVTFASMSVSGYSFPLQEEAGGGGTNPPASATTTTTRTTFGRPFQPTSMSNEPVDFSSEFGLGG